MLLPRRNFGADLFDEFFKEPVFSNPFGNQTASLMKTDIQDNGSNYHLEMELPGYGKEDIKAELKDGYLTIHAEKSSENDQKDSDGSYIRRERYYGSCKRSFYVGTQVKQEDIKASFENGILKMDVPKEAPKAIENTNNYIMIE